MSDGRRTLGCLAPRTRSWHPKSFFLLGGRDDPLAIADDHLPHFDRFGAVRFPDGRWEQLMVEGFEQVMLGLTGGPDRVLQEAGKLAFALGRRSLGDVRPNAVDGPDELRSQVLEPAREFRRELVDRYSESAGALVGLYALEVHAAQ